MDCLTYQLADVIFILDSYLMPHNRRSRSTCLLSDLLWSSLHHRLSVQSLIIPVQADERRALCFEIEYCARSLEYQKYVRCIFLLTSDSQYFDFLPLFSPRPVAGRLICSSNTLSSSSGTASGGPGVRRWTL